MRRVYRYVQGSILDAPEKVIAHGCNSRGAMGSGVAKAIADRWPEAKRVYDFAIASRDVRLGHVSWAEREKGYWVANVITQNTYGRDPNVRYASYDAIDLGLRNVVLEGREKKHLLKNDAVAIPLIGSGLGNADWNVVEMIISTIESDLDVTFIVYENSPKMFEKVTSEVDC